MTMQSDVPKRVLVVDDDDDIRDRFSTSLASKGWEVSTAADDAAVLENVRAHQPSVVLLDLKMPKKSGVEVLGELHTEFPWTRVIILTGHGEEEDAISCLNLGAFKYLRKPVSLNDLAGACELARRDVPLALWALSAWYAKLPDPDRVIFQTASGRSVSARSMMESVRQQTPQGREFVQLILEMSIELISKRLK